ncbi:hypothetical protein T261_8180 [Streptomyces lydicus]|nr:hypothetical protein T261_8180 [Streptomyces lydicus]
MVDTQAIGRGTTRSRPSPRHPMPTRPSAAESPAASPDRSPSPPRTKQRQLAGGDRIELPILSTFIGHDCRLPYSPSTRTVIWATGQDDDRWAIAEAELYTIIVRMLQAIHVDGANSAYKVLTRAILPAGSAEAVRRTQALVAQLRRRIEVLEEIHRDCGTFREAVREIAALGAYSQPLAGRSRPAQIGLRQGRASWMPLKPTAPALCTGRAGASWARGLGGRAGGPASR